MLWTIAVILIVLWVLGLVSSYTMGGFIHILLVIAVIVVLVNIIQGRELELRLYHIDNRKGANENNTLIGIILIV